MAGHRRDAGGGYSHRWVLIIITVLLAAALAGMLIYEHIESERRTAELKELARIQKEEEEAEEKELEGRYQAVRDVFDLYLPGIVCWGDSLTAGQGEEGTAYPDVLERLIQENLTDSFDLNQVSNHILGIPTELDAVSVLNMGVGGESTNTILGRNGAIPFVVSEDLTIPADDTAVEIKLESQNGKAVAPLRQGNAGMEYVMLDGVKGVISIEQENSTSSGFKYWFTRESQGEKTAIDKGTEIVTSGSESNLNYIPVIFIGQNGGYDSIEELIEQQRAIINHQSGNPEGRFIIIGLHTGTAEVRAELESAMSDEYGSQYINLREYMSTQGLTDAGIEATEEDLEMMEQGMTPASLKADNTHFNAVGYELIGNLIYQRMDELGYFDEVKGVIEEAMVPLG